MFAAGDAVGSDIRQIHGAHGALVWAKSKSVGCRQISSSAMIGRSCAQAIVAKKPVINLRFNIKRLSMRLSLPHRTGVCESGPTQIWPHLPALLDSLATAVCGGCNSIIHPVHARRYRGRHFLRSRMKEHDAQVFSRNLPVVDIGFHRCLGSRFTRHADEQKACSRDVQRHCRAVIRQGDLGVLACLQQNRGKISRACDQVLRNHGQ